MPFFSVNVSVPVRPDLERLTALPTQELAVPPLGLEQTLNVCATLPRFVTLKITGPGGMSDVFERETEISEG